MLSAWISSVGRGAILFLEHAGGLLDLFRRTLYWVFVGPFREKTEYRRLVFPLLEAIGNRSFVIVSLVAFLVGVVTFRSLAYASAFFVLAFLLEMGRFYAFGASRTLSRACWLWHIVRFPLYIAAAIWLWPTGRLLAIVVIAFIILQGLWLLASAVMMLPLRLLVSRLVYNWASHVHPQIHNMEGMAMARVITRWRSSVSR